MGVLLQVTDVTKIYANQPKPGLDGVSFEVNEGEFLGIMGASGSGKTTLLNVLSTIDTPTSGKITMGRTNIQKLNQTQAADFRKNNLGFIFQEYFLLDSLTVRENIAYGKPDAAEEEIIRAAVQANAHDFICKMPQGYDTLLGSSSRSLSGGEKQRISIARAILADPKILILDEATSAVDTETELAIQKSLERLEKGRTVLSIAHRLSTLRNATHLIVLDDGKLTESGTHEELLAKKGTFYKLSELQTKALAMRGIE